MAVVSHTGRGIFRDNSGKPHLGEKTFRLENLFSCFVLVHYFQEGPLTFHTRQIRIYISRLCIAAMRKSHNDVSGVICEF